MPPAKLAVASTVAAMILCGCGATVKPPQGRGKIDDPRTTKNNHFACLQQDRLPVQKVGLTGLQIGPLPDGPTVSFEPTDGAAQAAQIEGTAQGAEVVGSALLYPHQASDSELAMIEDCLSVGVSG
jgi:hypothetical protein